MDVSLRRRCLREPRSYARDALDFRNGIRAHIGRFRRVAPLLAEVDAAGQLAHEYQVHAFEHLGLDRRSVDQRAEHFHRPQVRIHTELAAQAQEPRLRPHFRGRRGPLRPADGAQQNRIRFEATLERRARQGIAVPVDGDAAEVSFGQLERMSEAGGDRAQATHTFGDDIGADAITAENRNARFHKVVRRRS